MDAEEPRMKIDLTRLVRGLTRGALGRTTPPVSDPLPDPPPAGDDSRVEQLLRTIEWSRTVWVPGTRPWGAGVFLYGPVEGLTWTADLDVEPADHVCGALESVGFSKVYKEPAWHLYGTRDRKMSEIRLRKIHRFIEVFGFDFRALATRVPRPAA